MKLFEGPWKAYALVTAFIVTAILLGLFPAGRKDTFAQQRIASLTRTNDSLRSVSRIVDTLYVRDTLRLRKLVERWDTVTLTVDRWKHDTIEVVQYVQLADSTIRSCSVALLTCNERVAIRDARIRAFEERSSAQESLMPSKWEGFGSKTTTAVVAIAIWEGGKSILRAVAQPP